MGVEVCNIETPDYSFKDSICNNNPTIRIKNIEDYDEIIIEPTPISKSFEEYSSTNNYYVVLDFGTNYQITFFNNKCTENQKIIIQTKNGSRFKSYKGACAGSKGSIEYIPDPDKSENLGDYKFLINNEEKVLPFYSVPGRYRVQALIGEENQCQTTITIPDSNIQREKKPNVILTNPICGESNGVIQISNFNDYTGISLQDISKTIQYEASSPGVFNHLDRGEYIITISDNQCGDIEYHYFLVNDLPSYQLEVIDNSCPTSPLMKLTINSSTLQYSIQRLGDTISNPFIAQFSEYSIVTDCGYFDFQVNLASSYPPVQYTAQVVDNYCQPYRITLLYNSDDFTNLKVLNNNGQELDLDSNKSFLATMDSLYYISDQCYRDTLTIGKTYPKPFFNYITKGKICSDLVTLQVLNWEDFSFIQLQTYDGVQYSMGTKGLFENVINQELMVSFIYRGCSGIQTTKIGETKRITQNDVDYSLNVLQYPTCFNDQGIGNLSIFNKDTKEFIASSVSPFTFKHANDVFQFNFGSIFGECYVEINGITIENYDFPKPIVTFTTVVNSSCSYAFTSKGEVRIDSNVPIKSITLDGKGVWLNFNDEYYTINADYGIHTYTLNFDGVCQPLNYTHFVGANDEFSLSYEIRNVTDCSQPNGALFINNHDQFDGITVDFYISGHVSQEYYANSEFWYTNLPSGSYKITIYKSYDDGSMCQGYDFLFLPTSLEVDLSYSMITRPICSEDNGGAIMFNYITLQDNSTRAIDYITYYSDEYVNNFIGYGFYPGHYSFNITSGSCAWRIPITITESPISFSYDTLWYYQGDSCSIEFGYQFDFSNNLILPDDVLVEPTGFITYYEDGLFFGSASSSFQVNLIFKDVCTFIVPFDIDQSLFQPNLNYSITRNPVCNSGDETFDIKILNPSDWFPLTIGNRSVDSSGIIKDVPKNVGIYGIEKKSNCQIDFKFLGSPTPNDNLNIDKEITDETCFGSKNGEIQFNDDNYNYYPFIATDTIGEQLLLPLLNSEDRNNFYDISSEEVTIEIIRKDRSKYLSTCKQYDRITLKGEEPTLIDNSNDQCSINGFGTIDVVPSIIGLEYHANLISMDKETSYTSKIDNIQPGDYILESYQITTDYCKRSFDRVSVTIGISIFSLNISSNPCQPVIITPSIINSTYSSELLYNYNINTPSNSSKQFVQSGVLTIDSLKEIGQYDLTVSDGNCIQTHKFNISVCPSGNDSSNSSSSNDGGTNNIGLAVGIPIGLVGLGAVSAGGVFFYKKRRNPTKTEELLPEKYDMETVTTFQGGHLVELDKF
ncbi:hypothetical protein ACTA71_001365 [Dictyostelium dimigraforme]